MGPAGARAARCGTSRLAARGAGHAGIPRKSFFLCHATPTRDEVYWAGNVLPTARSGCLPVKRSKEPPEGSRSTPLCGHAHIARAVRLADGRLIRGEIAGIPRCPPFSPHAIKDRRAGCARYAILEWAKDSWRVTFHHVPSDHEAMAALAGRNGQPELASALATGWMR